MNESTLTQLKIIVERAVRPVRASTPRKRKMREELLAHVSGVFEEESAKLGDDLAALERTAQRFGNPADLTSQLQETVPARDCIRRFWEGRPGESTMRTALRLACVTTVLALVIYGSPLFVVGWLSAWPGEALLTGVYDVLAFPLYLFGLAFFTAWMEKALYGPAGRSWLWVALIATCSLLLWVFWTAGSSWPNWPADSDYLSAALLTGLVAAHTVFFAGFMAHLSVMRRRYHEEWASLSID
jgi:hypothetical protein